MSDVLVTLDSKSDEECQRLIQNDGIEISIEHDILILKRKGNLKCTIQNAVFLNK